MEDYLLVPDEEGDSSSNSFDSEESGYINKNENGDIDVNDNWGSFKEILLLLLLLWLYLTKHLHPHYQKSKFYSTNNIIKQR